jgi:hypothetical protein
MWRGSVFVVQVETTPQNESLIFFPFFMWLKHIQNVDFDSKVAWSPNNFLDACYWFSNRKLKKKHWSKSWGGNDYCNPQTNSANVCKIINCLESSTLTLDFFYFW